MLLPHLHAVNQPIMPTAPDDVAIYRPTAGQKDNIGEGSTDAYPYPVVRHNARTLKLIGWQAASDKGHITSGWAACPPTWVAFPSQLA